VTFDPFGDFETRGYLRNFANEKDIEIVRRLEHTSFTTGIDAAIAHLVKLSPSLTRTFSRRIKRCSKLFIRGRVRTDRRQRQTSP
jgi:hypothetical protein